MIVSSMERSAYRATGYQMIRSVTLKNFRCFKSAELPGCGHVNLIVGDNGAGKTTLLEGMFFALGSGPELGVRFRQQRGLDGRFTGPSRAIEEEIWRDYFHNGDWGKTASIEIVGDGPESRSVRLMRGASQVSIPLEMDVEQSQPSRSPIRIIWRSADGDEYEAHPRVTREGFQYESEVEDLPDFFYFPSSTIVNSVETAGRFSDLNRAGEAKQFISIVTNEYKWLEDISVEVIAGSPVLYATLRGGRGRYPLANVSGGINRIVSIMLAIASRPRSVVLVDEIENGLYYKHHVALWRGLLALTRRYDGQLFMSTHSKEWLQALAKVTQKDASEVCLWRIRERRGEPYIRSYSGETLNAGIEYDEEVR